MKRSIRIYGFGSFAGGGILVFLGALAKLNHYPTANYFLNTGTILSVIGIALIIASLTSLARN